MSEENKKRLKEYNDNDNDIYDIYHNDKMHCKIAIAKIFFCLFFY